MNQKKVRIKAISSTVAAFIIATISVTLVGTTYFFSQGLLKGTTAETFEVVDVFSNMIIVRNAGTQPINNFTVLVDGKEINNQIKEPPIEPGKIGTVVLDLKDVPSGRHELVVMSKSMSTRWTWEFQYVSTTTSTTTTFTTTTEGIHGYSIKSLSEKEKNENPDFEFSNQKTIILNITKHSGFEKYIDLDVIKENETRFLVTYNFNKTILDDILKCKLGAVCGSSRLLGLKDKYFSELSTNDFIKSVDNITTYPVSNLTSGIKPVINSIDLSVSGSFYIDLLDYDPSNISKSVGKKVRIGFNTIEWTTVESTNNVGQDSSIALDSNGYAHISYRDTSNFDLRYCNNTLGLWTCTVLDTPANQQGYETSIAIDSNDKVHISHRDYTANDLRYCTNAQGTWSCTAVDTAGNVGTQGSIAIDKNDKVHISHRNFTGSYSSLRYCNNTLGTWTCTNAEAGASGIGSFGWYSSIAIDSNNKIHISHQNFTGGKYSLRYCNNTLGTWTCVQIETGNVGLDSSIAIDSNNKVHISHRNNSAAGYAIRYCNNIAGTWSCEKVDTVGALKYTSIAIDNNDKVHISHGDDTNFDLRYCNNTLGTWTCGVVDPLSGGSTDDVYTNGRGIAMKKGRLVDSTSFSPNISISYYDAGGGNLKYARLVNYLTLGPQVDTTPPIVTIESPTNTSYATATVWSNVTLNEAGSWCGLSFDGGSNVTMLNDSATHFYNQTTGLSQGGHNVRFYCNDTVDNMNDSASNKVYFTVDLTAPIVTIQSPLNQTYASTTVWANVTLNEFGSWCGVNNDSNSVNLTMTNTTGKWWYQFTGLSQGSHNFRFYCNDTAGNMNSSLNISFTVDTIPPIVTVQSPSNTTYLITTVWANLTLNEAGSWCGYNLDSAASNTTMQNFSGNYNSQITGLSEGGHNIRFYCNDTVGNMNGSVITYFTVGIPPKWSSIKTQPGTGIEYQPEGKYQFNVTWIDNSGVSNVIFEWRGKNISSYLWNNVSKSGDEYYLNITDLAAGTYNYKWYANDTYNNWNYTSPQTYQVNTAPSQTWLYLNWTQSDRSYNKSEIARIYANCTNCSSGESIDLQANYTGTLSPLNPHSHTIGLNDKFNDTNTANLALGPYLIKASTSDQNHSESQVNYTLIVVEKIPPQCFDNETNNTIGGYMTEFKLRWTDNNNLSSYIFYLDNCTGQLRKMNESRFPNGGTEDWSKASYVISSNTGCNITWMFEANDSVNNRVNSSNYSFRVTFAYLPVILGEPSPSLCNETNPCDEEQYKVYNVIATVTCKLVPPGKDCGVIRGLLRYNYSKPYPYDAIQPPPNIPLSYVSHFTDNLLPRDIINPAYKIENYYDSNPPSMNPFTDTDYYNVNVSDSLRITASAISPSSYCTGSQKSCTGFDNQPDCQACGCYWTGKACQNPSLGDCEYYTSQNDCQKCGCSWINPVTYAHFKFKFNLSSYGLDSIENITYSYKGYRSGTGTYEAYLQYYNKSDGKWYKDQNIGASENTYNRIFNSGLSDLIENGIFTFGATGKAYTDGSVTVYANYVTLIVNYNTSNPATCGKLNQGGTCTLQWKINTSAEVNKRYKIDVNFSSDEYKGPPNNVYNDTENAVIRIIDKIPPRYSNNSTNSTEAGKPILFSVKWTDNVGLSYAIFSLDNCTGMFTNITNMDLTGTSAWSNFTVTINSTPKCKIQWKVYANDTSNNWNISENSFNTTAPLKIWNLVIRDVPGELPIVKTITGVAVIISVNVSGDINYVEGNFTWPNGTMVYKNLTEISNKIYTYNWTYTILYVMPVGIARINVTAYDKYGFTNSTNTTLNISETAVLSLLNDPINFSTVSTGKVVNATEMRGWPLLAVVQGNMPMNLSQAAEEDLVGQTKSNIKIGVKNVTWNTTDYGIFSNLTTQFMRIVDNIMPNNNQSIYYKLNVPTVEPQYYSGNVSIKGEY